MQQLVGALAEPEAAVLRFLSMELQSPCIGLFAIFFQQGFFALKGFGQLPCRNANIGRHIGRPYGAGCGYGQHRR